MITISGYQLDEKLYESSRTLVYRGRRNADKGPAIIKILQKETPTPEDMAYGALQARV